MAEIERKLDGNWTPSDEIGLKFGSFEPDNKKRAHFYL